MQKVVALSTLQSLVSEHNKPIYQEALDCIKKELVVLAQQTINNRSPKFPLCICPDPDDCNDAKLVCEGDYQTFK